MVGASDEQRKKQRNADEKRLATSDSRLKRLRIEKKREGSLQSALSRFTVILR